MSQKIPSVELDAESTKPTATDPSHGHRLIDRARQTFHRFKDIFCQKTLPSHFPYQPTIKHQPQQTGSIIFLLIGLIILTIVPRIVHACRIDAVCDDAYYYMLVADAWKQSNEPVALQYLNLNVYPFILLGIRSTGLDWIIAGKLWGVIVSGLTILPLFGLLRRLYNEAVATVSCLLFAIHPQLIETSIEPIRGPTFWFLLVLSLYAIWRSAHTARWYWPVIAGLCTTLAVHTRTEGWVLLIPILLWPCLLRDLPISYWRKATTIVTTLAVIPLSLFIANVTILSDHQRWEWGRLTPLRNGYEWMCAEVSPENIHVSAKKLPRPPQATAPAPAQPQPTTAQHTIKKPAHSLPPEALSSPLSDGRLYIYLKQISQKFEPINLLFMLFGTCIYWRDIFRRDKIVMLLIFTGLMLAVWIRLAQIGDMNGRYFLSAYLIAIPFSAFGFLAFLNWVRNIIAKLNVTKMFQQKISIGVTVALMIFFTTDALTAQHSQRRAQGKLGIWLQRELGPFETVMVDQSAIRVGYFAHDQLPTLSYYFSTSGLGTEIRTPDLLIITRERSRPEQRGFIESQIARMQLTLIKTIHLPAAGKDFLIFSKRLPRSISRPTTSQKQASQKQASQKQDDNQTARR